MTRKAFDPAFTEAILKEKKIRVKWFKDYEAKKKAELTLEAEETSKLKSYFDERSRSGAFAWPKITGTATIVRVADDQGAMRNAARKDIESLYKGISHEGEGRIQYLKARKQLSPDEKYDRMLCSNWECGWKMEKQQEMLKCEDPEHCNVIRKCNDP